ncbi:MAG: hypothetical protein WCK90_04870 [archaeon]
MTSRLEELGLEEFGKIAAVDGLIRISREDAVAMCIGWQLACVNRICFEESDFKAGDELGLLEEIQIRKKYESKYERVSHYSALRVYYSLPVQNKLFEYKHFREIHFDFYEPYRGSKYEELDNEAYERYKQMEEDPNFELKEWKKSMNPLRRIIGELLGFI